MAGSTASERAWLRRPSLARCLDALPDRKLIGASTTLGIVLVGLIVASHLLFAPDELGAAEVVEDTFDDDGQRLLPGPDAPPWEVVGQWQVAEGEAVLAATPNVPTPATATLDRGSPDAFVVVEVGEAVQGWGVALRQEGPQDLLGVVAAPGYGGYSVVAVEGGRTRPLGSLALTPTAPGTELLIVVIDDLLVVVVDGGAPSGGIDVSSAPRGTRFGMLAMPDTAAGASWRSFKLLGPPSGGGSEVVPLPAAPGGLSPAQR